MRILEGNARMGFDTDAQNHFDRITSTEGQLYYDLDDLIVGLKTDGVWNKIDVLCVAHDVEADSLLNLKGSAAGAPDSTKIGSPVFAANQGFTMSSGNNIDMGVTESAATLYTVYSGHSMVYTRSFNETGSATVIGLKANKNFTRIVNSGPNVVGFNVHDYLINISQNTPMGFIGASCQSDTTRWVRLNDTVTGYYSSKSYSLETTTTIKVGSSASGSYPCIEQIAAWGIGSGLTAVELGLYEDRLRTFAQRRSFDVY